MIIHSLNCMTFHFGVPSITHCLLVESNQGLVLVDTGLGLRDYEKPSPKMKVFLRINRVPMDPDETAFRQISKLGHSPQDVRFIVLTHLHLDHSGGLPDFPWAHVHVHEMEHKAAMHPQATIARIGYDATHWLHNPQWVLHTEMQDAFFNLSASLVLGEPGSRIYLIPLPGHSPGHCGVAIEQGGHWLLHCGDAYVRDMQINPDNPRSPFPKWASIFERMLFPQPAVASLRMLMKTYGSRVRPFSSHDAIAFADLAKPQPFTS